MTNTNVKRLPVAVARLLAAVAMLATLVGSSATLAGCARPTVAVKTGERVVCTYGEQVSSTVRTIRVSAKDAGKYSVKTVTVTCDKHRALERAYAAAQTALANRDFATAKTELEKVVKVDATYRKAKQQLDEIAAGGKPAPDTTFDGAGTASSDSTSSSTPTTQTTPGKNDTPVGPVASLLVYTPDTLAGFKPQKVEADVFAVSRVYLPSSSGRITMLTIVAEQHRSDQAAQDWIRDNVRSHYTQSARNVRVGSHDGYLGTDGQRFAVIAWSEGPVSVALEADVTGAPKDVLGQLQELSSSIAR